ncbi:hypothetical protein VOLCADRAFT_88833 [Volvox carteri f. nagariensis]|uniref:Uncharacterized protein n=1 Tax=Volvox carteri f. nagariensis TaxID=3068 RepID=D8TQ29_VOLCA|nr:uncharacterized protein VOLCADRAFT_88833 [Volvox carteri f. nagariensis]EFJ50332.1 hypothetical protein VOLCADRAFT_88833 [Volvox carteri f. nagariensis]|eukprot:XP_002948457.1 hypothetical protein VOLCADRAFT_88833 [Volvox carteri f. nagariensis]
MAALLAVVLLTMMSPRTYLRNRNSFILSIRLAMALGNTLAAGIAPYNCLMGTTAPYYIPRHVTTLAGDKVGFGGISAAAPPPLGGGYDDVPYCRSGDDGDGGCARLGGGGGGGLWMSAAGMSLTAVRMMVNTGLLYVALKAVIWGRERMYDYDYDTTSKAGASVWTAAASRAASGGRRRDGASVALADPQAAAQLSTPRGASTALLMSTPPPPPAPPAGNHDGRFRILPSSSLSHSGGGAATVAAAAAVYPPRRRVDALYGGAVHRRAISGRTLGYRPVVTSYYLSVKSSSLMCRTALLPSVPVRMHTYILRYGVRELKQRLRPLVGLLADLDRRVGDSDDGDGDGNSDDRFVEAALRLRRCVADATVAAAAAAMSSGRRRRILDRDKYNDDTATAKCNAAAAAAAAAHRVAADNIDAAAAMSYTTHASPMSSRSPAAAAIATPSYSCLSSTAVVRGCVHLLGVVTSLFGFATTATRGNGAAAAAATAAAVSAKSPVGGMALPYHLELRGLENLEEASELLSQALLEAGDDGDSPDRGRYDVVHSPRNMTFTLSPVAVAAPAERGTEIEVELHRWDLLYDMYGGRGGGGGGGVMPDTGCGGSGGDVASQAARHVRVIVVDTDGDAVLMDEHVDFEPYMSYLKKRLDESTEAARCELSCSSSVRLRLPAPTQPGMSYIHILPSSMSASPSLQALPYTTAAAAATAGDGLATECSLSGRTPPTAGSYGPLATLPLLVMPTAAAAAEMRTLYDTMVDDLLDLPVTEAGDDVAAAAVEDAAAAAVSYRSDLYCEGGGGGGSGGGGGGMPTPAHVTAFHQHFVPFASDVAYLTSWLQKKVINNNALRIVDTDGGNDGKYGTEGSPRTGPAAASGSKYGTEGDFSATLAAGAIATESESELQAIVQLAASVLSYMENCGLHASMRDLKATLATLWPYGIETASAAAVATGSDTTSALFVPSVSNVAAATGADDAADTAVRHYSVSCPCPAMEGGGGGGGDGGGGGGGGGRGDGPQDMAVSKRSFHFPLVRDAGTDEVPAQACCQDH